MTALNSSPTSQDINWLVKYSLRITTITECLTNSPLSFLQYRRFLQPYTYSCRLHTNPANKSLAAAGTTSLRFSVRRLLWTLLSEMQIEITAKISVGRCGHIKSAKYAHLPHPSAVKFKNPGKGFPS